MTRQSSDIEIQEVTLPPDTELYPQLMAKNGDAWRSFHSYYLERLRMYFTNHNVNTLEDREDLVQETFTKFFRTLLGDRYNPQKGALVQWLYGIAEKLLKDHKRRYAQEYTKQDRMHEGIPGESTTDDDADSASTLYIDPDRLHDALAQLSDKLRSVVLRKTELSTEWTWKELAKELGISESAAKMRHQRGIEELKRLLS